MEIRQEIKRRAADIEARIAPFLPQEKGFQQTVLDAMEYSVFAGGKLDTLSIEKFMERRAPGRNKYSTTRREADKPVQDGAALLHFGVVACQAC